MLVAVGVRLEVEDDLFDGARERVGGLGLVVQVDDETVVAADVHAGVGGEGDRDGASARPSPICLSFAQSVTLPPAPGLFSSASNSILTMTSPVGIGSVETCL